MAATRTARKAAVATPVEAVETPAPEVEAPAATPAVETAEVVEEAAPVFLPATELDADVATEYAAIVPFLELAKMGGNTLSVEVRGERLRMSCSWGRKSYFAPFTAAKDGTPILPSQVKAALIRQIARQKGKALRAIKADDKAAKKLAELLKAAETPAEA